ncbi:hypothetical protein NDU88_000517 [Pleurodeles waltl]|uniref:Uncharacterized protein n=1 Tax=Pleurodeles waltl TaxID=8319 RepID=A0AAV7P1J8_PLEWA|nr:hypothetical protein NDU88_000517 [Pleurodeles waltl]
MAVGGAAGPWGPLQCPCQWHGHCRGPPKRAPQSISVSAKQTLKYATGATAPVAPLQLRRLNSEPASSLQGHCRWAGGRSFGERPPAQRKCVNGRRGLLTAVRSFVGGTLADGLCRPPRSE